MPKPRSALTHLLAGLLALALLPAAAKAQVAKQASDTLASLAFQSERLAPSQPIEALDAAPGDVSFATQSAWGSFRSSVPAGWKASVDQRTGLIAFAEGGNVAWLPGRGNALTRNDVAAYLKPGAARVDLAGVEAIARGYLPRLALMMGVDPSSLVLNPGRSGQPAGHVWFVDFDVVKGGMVVEGARVLFRVNNGNLIQFGSEYLPAPGAAVPPTQV
ncbi:MAG TPA: hypothetical protein VIH93_01875, partial [Thermoanaerobaculia bacterium]